MSKIPHTATLPLKGIDLACQTLSARMVQNLTWLNYGFGLCQRIIEEDASGKEHTIPVIYVNDIQEGQRAYPNDEWRTFCFWDVSDPMTVPKAKDETEYSLKFLTYKAACIIYMDMSQIDNQTTFQVTRSKLKDDILQQFSYGFIGCGSTVHMTGMVDRTVKDVYKDIYDDQLHDLTTMPHACFRVECEIIVRQVCTGSINTYSYVTTT